LAYALSPLPVVPYANASDNAAITNFSPEIIPAVIVNKRRPSEYIGNKIAEFKISRLIKHLIEKRWS